MSQIYPNLSDQRTLSDKSFWCRGCGMRIEMLGVAGDLFWWSILFGLGGHRSAIGGPREQQPQQPQQALLHQAPCHLHPLHLAELHELPSPASPPDLMFFPLCTWDLTHKWQTSIYYSRWTKYSNPATRTMLNPAHPNLNVSVRVLPKVMLGVWFLSSTGANALQVTLTLNFGREGFVPDRKGLNISSIYGSIWLVVSALGKTLVATTKLKKVLQSLGQLKFRLTC